MRRHPRTRHILFLVMVSAVFICTGYTRAEPKTEIRFLTHAPAIGRATYIDDADNIRGLPGSGRRAFLVELVNAMIVKHGGGGKIIEVPFARGKMIIENKTGYAFFNFMRNQAREHHFKWVGPIYSQPTYFYAYRHSEEPVSSMADARRTKAVCGIRGTNNINWLDRHGFNNIFEASSFDACLQLMLYGRVTLIQSAEIPEFLLSRRILGKPILAATGLGNHHELLPGEEILKGYLAFNIHTPDSQITAWQKALDDIKASGLHDQLRQIYLLPALTPHDGTQAQTRPHSKGPDIALGEDAARLQLGP